jgi:hypothetical protein
VTWFRLPVAGDRRCWAPETLAAVIEGRAPAPRLVASARCPSPGLHEIVLRNEGDADAPLPGSIAVAWSEGRYLGGDAFSGYEAVVRGARSLRLSRRGAPGKLRPGASLVAGWFRLEGPNDAEVRVDPDR